MYAPLRLTRFILLDTLEGYILSHASARRLLMQMQALTTGMFLFCTLDVLYSKNIRQALRASVFRFCSFK